MTMAFFTLKEKMEGQINHCFQGKSHRKTVITCAANDCLRGWTWCVLSCQENDVMAGKQKGWVKKFR